MSGKPIIIGGSEAGDVALSPKTRSTHLHVIGGTGVGKSYLLEHMIRRDIRSGHGVCLIDPHGETYDNLVEWLARMQYQWPVHLLNPSEDDWALGFNPLVVGDGKPEARVDAMVDACLKVWGNDENVTPRLSKCLRLTFYALAVHKLSILEAGLLTQVSNAEVRRRLTADLPNEEYARQWQEFNDGYTKKQFVEYFESTNSRLLPFLASPPIRRMMGQSSPVLNLRTAMDRGEIVLVNLNVKGEMTSRNAQLIGAMLFSDLFVSARRRDVATAREHPFYCYVDECADYLTDDIARILDQTRKFGLHLTLAHQRLQQLRQASDTIYSGVMESAKSKIVFRVDDDDSAEVLSRHLFRKQFDLERPKESMIRPTVVGQEREHFYSESETQVESEAEGFSVGHSSGTSSNAAQSIYVPDAPGVEVNGHTQFEGEGETSGTSRSESTSRGSATATTSGWSEGMVNVFADLPTSLFTLEEQIHEGIVQIRAQPDRQAIAYLAGEARPIIMGTPDVVKRFVRPRYITEYVEAVHIRNPCSKDEASQVAEREARSDTWAKPELTDPEDSEDDFRAPPRAGA